MKLAFNGSDAKPLCMKNRNNIYKSVQNIISKQADNYKYAHLFINENNYDVYILNEKISDETKAKWLYYVKNNLNELDLIELAKIGRSDTLFEIDDDDDEY
ncbi:MAG: hypothetical protein NTW25_11180 [Candidatus Kapabacteria bacterium]|nr:hypothetical protein [Candidatus Kapabacteria bacterium]